MNATVTKAVKSAGKSAPKTIAAGKAKPAAGKTAAKSAVKVAAVTPKKTVRTAAKTAATPAKKTTAKSAVKSPAPTKAKAPAAARSSAAKTAKPAPAKVAAPARKTGKPAAGAALKTTAAARKTAPPAAAKNASRSGTGAATRSTSRIADNIDPSVVSKASEVATKTSKTTPENGALLTEEQILKMGEKDYMNDAQLAFFKDRLQQLEREILRNADETTEHLRETVLVPDPADRATIEEEHALELRTRDRERKLLKKVQQSIAAIDAGEYGWCEETGEPIGVARLLARPTATLSLEAQQRRELKQKLYGD